MNHVVVWMDGNEAKIFHVDAEHLDEATIRSPNHHVHRHPKAQETRDHAHPDDAVHFFSEVARKLTGATAVLLVGPAMTKLHFLRYLQKHDSALESRIVGLESAGHPTDGQLVAHARAYFSESPPRRGE